MDMTEDQKNHKKELILIWARNNPEKRKKYRDKWIDKNIEKEKERKRKWKRDNPEKIAAQDKISRIKNPEKRADIERRSQKLRRDTNEVFKLSTGIRTLIGKSFREKGFSKSSHTYEILGCTFEEFKTHIESQFEPWMTWENRGKWNGELNYGWDLDHKIPISSANTKEDVLRLNHYSNFQPLCSHVNRYIKINKINFNETA